MKDSKASRPEPMETDSSNENARTPGAGYKSVGTRAVSGAGYPEASSNHQRRAECPAFLSKTHTAVRPQLEAATDLRGFKKKTGELLLSERRLIVEQALVLLEQNYVHLPLKKAIHAVDPTQRLRLLKFQLAETTSERMPDELEFHAEMLRIFTSLRDYHTAYILPSPYKNSTAFLPFLVEEYFGKNDENDENGLKKRYLVSHVLKEFDKPHFKTGVEILYWNGIPIERAIRLNGENQAGSNLEARFAGGLDALTIRPLISSLPPDEEWVTITYRSLAGKTLELRQRWLVIPSWTYEEELRNAARASAAKLSIYFQKAIINQVRTVLFAPEAIAARNRIRDATNQDQYGRVKPDDISNKMPEILRVRKVHTQHGTFAYIRIFSFELDDVDEFIAEFQRLIKLLPQKGLIIDVRNNGGGAIAAGERLLQFLTPGEIESETFEFINTPLNLLMCRTAPEEKGLSQWSDSIAQSVLTAATYSVGFPLTSKKECNDIGQRYKGPVVLIIDALCYSTTDIFAAGFQDHAIGLVLGTNARTGAGGANVWTHADLLSLLGGRRNSPLEELPGDVNVKVAIRRSRRVGERAGTPLEEFGVTADEIHRMTRRDVLRGNIDLINHATEILSRLSVEVKTNPSGHITVVVKTKNVSRLEVTIGEEKKSLDVQDGEVQLKGHVPPFVRSILRVRGFGPESDGGPLVAVRNISVCPRPEFCSMKGELQMATTSKESGSKGVPGGGGEATKGVTTKGKGKGSPNKGSKGGSGGVNATKSGKSSSKKRR